MSINNKDAWKFLPWDIQGDILSRLFTNDLLKLQSFCKDWQFIIISQRFHILQTNANSNQNGIILHTFHKEKCQFSPLNSNEIYKFDIPILMDFYYKTWILVVSNGLVFLSAFKDLSNYQLLVYNPRTKECIKLPQLPYLHFNINHYYYIACDFLNMICNQTRIKYFLFGTQMATLIYRSSPHTWQCLNSFCNFKSNLQLGLHLYSCITYKINIYVVFCTSKHEAMMVVYDPIMNALE